MAEMKNGEEFHYFEDDEISLLDLLLVLARQKKIIMGITTLFVVVAIIASLLMTKVYQASTRILNPVQRPSFASLMEEKAGLMGDLLSLGPTGGNVYVSMLKSRSLQDQVLDRFVSNGWRDMVGAGKEMRRHDFVAENIGEMSVTEEKNGTILVTVSYTDQYKVADIANAYVEELQHMADHFFPQKRLSGEDIMRMNWIMPVKLWPRLKKVCGSFRKNRCIYGRRPANGQYSEQGEYASSDCCKRNTAAIPFILCDTSEP